MKSAVYALAFVALTSGGALAGATPPSGPYYNSAGVDISGTALDNRASNPPSTGAMNGYTVGGVPARSTGPAPFTPRAMDLINPAGGSQMGIGFSARDRRTLDKFVRDISTGPARGGTSLNVGQIIPGNVTVTTLPAKVARTLKPAPDGYSYVQSGTHVYLIDNASRRIVDRITSR